MADRTDGDGQSNPLQERKVDVDVEPLRFAMLFDTKINGRMGSPNEVLLHGGTHVGGRTTEQIHRAVLTTISTIKVTVSTNSATTAQT